MNNDKTQGHDLTKRGNVTLSRGRKGSLTGNWRTVGNVKEVAVIVHSTQKLVWIPESCAK